MTIKQRLLIISSFCSKISISMTQTATMKFFDSPTMRETIHRLLRSQMALKGIDYNSLSERLALFGVVQTPTNLRSKINHGTLGAQLFVYIQFALGINELDIRTINSIYQDVDDDLKRQAVKELARGSLTSDDRLVGQERAHG